MASPVKRDRREYTSVDTRTGKARKVPAGQQTYHTGRTAPQTTGGQQLRGAAGIGDLATDAAPVPYQPGDTFDVVTDSGRTVTISVLTRDEIPEMKHLDDECFGQHQGISEEALENIYNNGYLLCVRDPETGEMIGEAQLITTAIPTADEHIVRHLGEDDAYFEGFAVRGDQRGSDAASALCQAQKEIAMAAGKTTMYATVRPENAASVKRLTREGFAAVAYEPHYYEGDGGAGARLVLAGDLAAAPGGLSDTATQTQHAADNGQPIHDDEVTVTFGDEVDVFAHSGIWERLGPSRDGRTVGTGITVSDGIGRMTFSQLPERFNGYDRYAPHAPTGR